MTRSGTGTDADTPAAIRQLLLRYAESVHAKDVGAFMRLYDPNVRVFDTWGVWSYEGAAAWQAAVDGIPLADFALKHPELARSIEKFGDGRAA